MQRMSVEEADKLQKLDLEQEKANARLNLLVSVVVFVGVVGALRVGKIYFIAPFMLRKFSLHKYLLLVSIAGPHVWKFISSFM